MHPQCAFFFRQLISSFAREKGKHTHRITPYLIAVPSTISRMHLSLIRPVLIRALVCNRNSYDVYQDRFTALAIMCTGTCKGDNSAACARARRSRLGRVRGEREKRAHRLPARADNILVNSGNKRMLSIL